MDRRLLDNVAVAAVTALTFHLEDVASGVALPADVTGVPRGVLVKKMESVFT